MSVRIAPIVTTVFIFLFGLCLPQVVFGNTGKLEDAGNKPAYAIGSRLELFVDDFLVDRLTGSAERRMHPPIPREIVHTLDKPWEGDTSAYLAVVQDGGLIRIYYNASPRFRSQTTAVIESHDGINFRRPNLGIVDFEGSTDNNLLPQFGTAGHHFTPFVDNNPATTPDARYKAFARGPGGMRFYASPDGYDWRMLDFDPKIVHGDEQTRPATDTQNLAFWDPVRERYMAYLRLFRPHRCIRYATSMDLVNWTETLPVEYDDDRAEQLYTNGIRPYDRAPHIYIGLPNRIITGRQKVAAHPNRGINDVVLMSSRDGKRFQRWAEAFIRPGTDPEVWTDRNNYPAWGLARTSPTELSLYWTEHYRHAGMRFRRGTIRVDGFVSVYADSEGGEVLTRPLIFSGDRLVVNYRTSAGGDIRFELADEEGSPIEGFTLEESDELFGNAIEHMVSWRGGASLSAPAGRPIRLRVRLRDADLYSFRFETAAEILARLTASADAVRALLADPLPAFASRCQRELASALDQYETRLARDRELAHQDTLAGGFLIRRALHHHQLCARLVAEARAALDAAAAFPPSEDGFGGHYHDILNTLCEHVRSTLADPAAGPAGLRTALVRVQEAMADLDKVADCRTEAAARLADAGVELNKPTTGFGALFQTQIAARRDALALQLADQDAAIAAVFRATEALSGVVSSFSAADVFPAVVPAKFTGRPPVYAEQVADDWKRGMLVNLVVEDDDLALVSEPTLCFDEDPALVRFPVGDALKPAAFTVEAWVKLQDPYRRWTPVVRIGRDPVGPPPRDGWTDISWSLWLNGLSPQAVVRVGEDETLARTKVGPSLDLNRWHHLAASFDGAILKLFIDGELAGQVEQAGAIDYTWSEALLIGGCPHQQGDAYNNFRGRIRDVRIWDHARKEPEIMNDRQRQLAGDEIGLVGHWVAGPNAGEGETVFDLTGRGNDGRRVNARWLPSSGYRIVGPIRFGETGPAFTHYKVAWQATVEGEASLDIFTGFSESPQVFPDVWSRAVNSKPALLPDADQPPAERYGWIKQALTCADPGSHVRLHALTFTIE